MESFSFGQVSCSLLYLVGCAVTLALGQYGCASASSCLHDLDRFNQIIGTDLPNQRSIGDENRFRYSVDIPLPWNRSTDTNATEHIDPRALRLVRHLFPDTGLNRTGVGKPKVFETVQELATVEVSGLRLHVVMVRTMLWAMLAPRGYAETLVLDDFGRVVGSEMHCDSAKLEGTVLWLCGAEVGVDLASPHQVRLWRDQGGLVSATNSLGLWRSRLLRELIDTQSDGIEARVSKALSAEWNSEITHIYVVREDKRTSSMVRLDQLPDIIRNRQLNIERPTLANIRFDQTGIVKYDKLGDPWTGFIVAHVVERGRTIATLRFDLCGAKPGS